ncbi:DUF885 domain-containing protein [Pyxidicoccus fallax]|uniref:DUF885 domain-containing protein n=1 Tax=Pyxidicoccus fallax TaxID=394095 RepID=A0A848LBY5_9BACT|nr:DUF885 domain-containing protein [Pyxidicoccus fallax]NMO14335.1 DUF885 domain-containing protein [Pyxidicoccus fallax]NPC82470.1 DUF885 domain-containing protein [Pyxidicoccus fallax]
MVRVLFLLALGSIAMLSPDAEAAKSEAPAAALHKLIQSEWQYQLEHSPTYASVAGDRRWNDRWDDLSLQAIEADHQHNLQVIARLKKLDRAKLSAADQLNYDLFLRDYELWAEEHRFKWYLLPSNHMGSIPEGIKQPPGVQTAYQLADNLRFETVRDYEDWIARLKGFSTYVDQVIALMREGLRQGLVHPQPVVRRMPSQVEKQLVEDPAKSGFHNPFERFPASIPAAEQQRLAAAGRAAIAQGVLPALKRYHQFLTTEYVPKGPEQVGIWQLPQGAELYAFLARKYTTTSLTPDEIHALGLSEVKRIRAEMEAVKAKAGFQGSLAEFFRFLRSDARFYYKTGDELLTRYRSLSKRIDPLLVRLFKTLPRQPYGVEPTPEAMAPDATTGFYYPGASDGSRPGTYLVNLYRPETRPRWEMVPLTLHEAVPGHHLQTSLAAEQTGIPDFRRFGYHVAYGEGWALYCETLGDELGLYEDPYDKFGQLAYDMWRAVRLVVDTGMHSKRWTRQQALDFFMENSPRQELDTTNEVDRYIAWPAQALAYKIGQLKIRELRTRAEKELGSRFDVREFHDVVLLDGSLPLDVLEKKVQGWVAARKAAPAPR